MNKPKTVEEVLNSDLGGMLNLHGLIMLGQKKGWSINQLLFYAATYFEGIEKIKCKVPSSKWKFD